MTIPMALAVFLGGGLGAIGRYLVGVQALRLLGAGFPWGTLAVNVLGSFAMGALVGAFALAWSPSQELRAFLTVGLLGGFTTFSAFSADTMLLVERGEGGLAVLYVAASVGLSLGAILLALRLTRAVLA